MPNLRITDLPEELLQSILLYVKETESSDAFWDCLNTCRQWHRVGLGLFKGLGFAASAIIESNYRRREIDGEGLNLNTHLRIEFDVTAPSPLYLSLLRSLTIHVQHYRISSQLTAPQHNTFIRSLNELFVQTSRLTTFSLRFSEDWDFPNLDVPAVPESVLVELIESLPETVTSLELDTSGTEVPTNTETATMNHEHHLCYQISKILRRLYHLRLRIGHICGALLTADTIIPVINHRDGCNDTGLFEDVSINLLRTWHMRTMIVWLPWGQILSNDRFTKTFSTLLDSSM